MTTTQAVDVPAQPRKASSALEESWSRTIDGLRVVEERPILSNLPIPEGRDPRDFAHRGFTELILEDGSSRMACADCEYYGPTRGAVQKHRMRIHHTGTKPRKRPHEPQDEPVQGLPADLRSMSLGDVLELGAQVRQLGVVIDNVTAQRDEYLGRLRAAEARLAQIDAALGKAGYAREAAR